MRNVITLMVHFSVIVVLVTKEMEPTAEVRESLISFIYLNYFSFASTV